jgi:deoxyribodipyrimidine photo-lyase
LHSEDYSTKLSPWLAAGCISPRRVVSDIHRYEATRVKNKDTYWLIFELTFRDYFRYYVRVHGNSVFKKHGPRGRRGRGPAHTCASGEPLRWSLDEVALDKWRLGQTGNPMIDACMRELLHTGYMSNRGRQIVASFLTRDLGLDWRLGAMYFESVLMDHDVCLNWGNWTYAAGVGSDPREDRYFSVPKQTSNYDKDHRCRDDGDGDGDILKLVE